MQNLGQHHDHVHTLREDVRGDHRELVRELVLDLGRAVFVAGNGKQQIAVDFVEPDAGEYAIRAWMAWSSTSDNFLMDATYGRTIRMQEQESAGAAYLANYIGGIVPPDRRLPLRKSLILFLLLIFLPIADKIQDATYTVYDGACGTGGMFWM